MSNAVVYVGRISPRTTRRDLEKKFEVFGELNRCDLKTNYAFIGYRDPKSATEACRSLDNTELDGVRILVEPSRRGEGRCYACGKDGHWARECRESRGRQPGGRGDRRESSGSGGGRQCYTCGEVGHFARDCRNVGSSSRRGGSSRSFGERYAPYRRTSRYGSPIYSPRGSRSPSPSSPRGRRRGGRSRSPSSSGSSLSPRGRGRRSPRSRTPERYRRRSRGDSRSPSNPRRRSSSPRRESPTTKRSSPPRESPKPNNQEPEEKKEEQVENKEQ